MIPPPTHPSMDPIPATWRTTCGNTTFCKNTRSARLWGGVCEPPWGHFGVLMGKSIVPSGPEAPKFEEHILCDRAPLSHDEEYRA